MISVGTYLECEALRVTRDKLLGPPASGFHMGRGRHCDMPETWDGQGEVPDGWTGYAGPIEHPDRKGEFAVETGGDETTAKLADPVSAATLTEQERTELAAKVATAVDKETWLSSKEPATVVK